MTDASEDPAIGRGATLGAQLRRLSERVDRDVSRLYDTVGFRFEQRWFGVLDQIVRNGPMTVGAAAAALKITHVSVSQSARSLEAAGYISSAIDPSDARRRRLSLTTEGEHLVASLTPLWREMEAQAQILNREVGDLAHILDRLERALDERSLFTRVRDRMTQELGPQA